MRAECPTRFATVRHPESRAFQPMEGARRWWARGVWRDWDLLVLIGLTLANVRVFNGSSVASFELVELFAWGYCGPFVLGTMLQRQPTFCPMCRRLLAPVFVYMAWVVLSAAAAIVFRHDFDVLQQTKNVVVAVPIVMFICIRMNDPASFGRIMNIYVLYCLAACWQYKTGAPYFRAPVENNEYKLDYTGQLVDNVVLGFSATPNQLALITLPGFIFSAIKLASEIRARRIPRLATLIATLGTGIVIFLAESRGALVWAFVALAFFIAPTRRSRSFLLKLLLVAGLIGLIVMHGLSADNDAAGTDTLWSRWGLWMTAIRAFTSDWYVAFLGDGSGWVTKWSWQAANWTFPDSHNGWLDQAVFFGIPAVGLYLAIWWVFFRIVDEGANRGRLPETRRVFLDGIRATVMALMGLYFFEPVANAVFPVTQLFIFLACGVKLSSLSPTNNASRQGSAGVIGLGRLTTTAPEPARAARPEAFFE